MQPDADGIGDGAAIRRRAEQGELIARSRVINKLLHDGSHGHGESLERETAHKARDGREGEAGTPQPGEEETVDDGDENDGDDGVGIVHHVVGNAGSVHLSSLREGIKTMQLSKRATDDFVQSQTREIASVVF